MFFFRQLVKLSFEKFTTRFMMIKKFSQLFLGAFLLFFSTNAFALEYYASFRDTQSQSFAAFASPGPGESLTYETEDINFGGAITREDIGTRTNDGRMQHQFRINVSGNYLIIATVNSLNGASGTFDILVNGVEQDRLSTNTATSNILPLQAGDVIRISITRPTSGILLFTDNQPNTETNTASITFLKVDSAPAGGPPTGPGCSGGLL